jgi:hypothetical protein
MGDSRPSGPISIIHPVLWWGFGVLVLGVGPLVVILLAARWGWTADPNPNPVGPGILAWLTRWPATILIAVGVALSLGRWRERRARRRPPEDRPG